MFQLPSHALLAGVMFLHVSPVTAQGTVTGSRQPYPVKPVRILTGDVGGGNDFASRLIAQGLMTSLGQQVIVENRTVRILAVIAQKAAPDGYSLLLTGGSFWLLPYLQDHVPYDPVKDFAPITLATRAPNVLVVHPSQPITSVRELIALAKARPGQLNCGMGPAGSSPHLAGELFKTMAEVNIVGVPYKGMAPALSDLVGGQLQLIFATPSAAAPHVKSGRIRALAVTSATPSALAPGLPSVAASGLPGYRAESLYGVWAPAGTPAAILNLLNRNIVAILGNADVKDKFLATGIESVGTSAEEFAATIKSEMARMGKVIKDAGIRSD